MYFALTLVNMLGEEEDAIVTGGRKPPGRSAHVKPQSKFAASLIRLFDELDPTRISHKFSRFVDIAAKLCSLSRWHLELRPRWFVDV